MLDFPETAYDNDPELKFSIQFVSPRTVRIKMLTTAIEPKNDDAQDIMLNGVPKTDNTWRMTQTAKSIVYSSEYGTIEIQKYPWRIILEIKRAKY